MGTVVNFPHARRRNTRVPFDQPVALVHGNSTVATALGADISIRGLQARCDRYTIDSLVRRDASLRGEASPHIDVHFRLPVGSNLLKVDARCRLIYVVELDAGEHALGLHFEVLEGIARANLMLFLSESQELLQR